MHLTITGYQMTLAATALMHLTTVACSPTLADNHLKLPTTSERSTSPTDLQARYQIRGLGTTRLEDNRQALPIQALVLT